MKMFLKIQNQDKKMNTCQHFKPFTYTTDQHPYNFGKCQRVENYLANGGSVEKTEEIIINNLNGALKFANKRYLFTGCDSDRGCEFFAS